MPPGQEHYMERGPPPEREYARPPPAPPRETRPPPPPPPQRVARPPPPPPRYDTRPPPPRRDTKLPPPQHVFRPPPPGQHPTRPPPLYAAPTTGGRGHFIGGLFFAILLLIAVVVGFYSTSWYSSNESALGYTVSLDYGLSKMEGSLGFTTVAMDYDDIEGQTTVSSPIIDTANTTKGILILGLILLVIFILLALVGALGKAGDSLRRATPIVGYLAGLIFLVAVIYFAVAFANAVDEESSSESSGSLGAAWSAVFLGSLLMLLGAEIIRRAPSDADIYEPQPYYPAY